MVAGVVDGNGKNVDMSRAQPSGSPWVGRLVVPPLNPILRNN